MAAQKAINLDYTEKTRSIFILFIYISNCYGLLKPNIKIAVKVTGLTKLLMRRSLYAEQADAHRAEVRY
jgi:hypothetical protein